MRAPENVYDESAEYPQYDHTCTRQEEERRVRLSDLSDPRCYCKQRKNTQDAQHDGERIPGDAAHILRFLSIESNTCGFRGGQRADTEDDGNIVDVGADDDAEANGSVATGKRHQGCRIVGDIGPQRAEEAQQAGGEVPVVSQIGRASCRERV